MEKISSNARSTNWVRMGSGVYIIELPKDSSRENTDHAPEPKVQRTPLAGSKEVETNK